MSIATDYRNSVSLGNYTWWSPWYGCEKVSPACLNCYIKVRNFCLADIDGTQELASCAPGTIVITSLLTDFFWDEADDYRERAWAFIRNNPHLIFLIITKKLDHGITVLPPDWGDGWNNVIIKATIDNNEYAAIRIPQLRNFPAKHKWLACSPLIEELDLEAFLAEGWIEHVECSGEIGNPEVIRETRHSWVKSLSDQCKKTGVRFSFMKCGNKFITTENKMLSDSSYCYQSEVADTFNLSYYVPIRFELADGTIQII